MMKGVLIFIIIGWGLCQDTLWTRRYDNSLDEAGYGIATDNDGNIIVAGVTIDLMGGTVPGNCLIVKYSTAGNLLWAKEYDAGGDDWLCDLDVDRNGNIIAVGSTVDTILYHGQVLIVKCTASGDTIWSRRYQNLGYEFGLGIDTDSLNNIYVSGQFFDGFSDNILLLKCSPDGTLIWSKFYDFGEDEIGYHNVVSSNGNIYICGIYYSSSGYDYLMLKCNSDGDTLWLRTYNFGQDEWCTDITLDQSENILLTGIAFSGTYDILTVKCNANGDTIWSRIFDYGGDDEALGIAINSNNDIFIAGVSEGNLYDYLTLRYTQSGYLKWEGRFDTGSDDQGLGITVDNSDNIIVSGASYNGVNYDYLIVKYRSDVGVKEIAKTDLISPRIFPNLVSKEINLQIPDGDTKTEIKIYDVCGRVVKSGTFNGRSSLIRILVTDFPPGTYFVEIKTEKKNFINKFVVVR